MSQRTVSDLERGINRTARKDTAGLLGVRGLLDCLDERFTLLAGGDRLAGTASSFSSGEKSWRLRKG